jgi:hypothetical protein
MPDDQCISFDELLCLGFGFSDWEFAGIFRLAKCFNRAHMAFWVPRYANERAKIEKSGVECAAPRRWTKICCTSPQCFSPRDRIDRFERIEYSCQNSSRVRFYDRDGLIEGEAGYGVSGVFTDAREPSHLVDLPGELSAMVLQHRSCGGKKISSASVIAEALPRAEYVIFAGAR